MKFLSCIFVFVTFLKCTAQPYVDIKWNKSQENKLIPKGFQKIQLDADETFEMNLYALGSESVKFDTSKNVVGSISGIQYKGEFLWFKQHPKVNQYKNERTAYMSPLVTNSDYLTFKEFVRDSVMRKALLDEFKPSDNMFAILTYTEDGELASSDDWIINWESKYKYGLPPLKSKSPNRNKLGQSDKLAHFFYPSHERLDNRIEIDQRNLFYKFEWIDIIGAREEQERINKSVNDDQKEAKRRPNRSRFVLREMISLLRDTSFWYRTDLPENYQRWLTENYSTHDLYKDSPAIGLTGYQAWAYVKWLEESANGHNNGYFIELELPRKIEVEKRPLVKEIITIPKIDNPWWRISNKDYYQFLKATSDSVLLRVFSESFDPEDYLIKTYDIEGELNETLQWRLDKKANIKPIARSKHEAHQEVFNSLIGVTSKFWEQQELLSVHHLNYGYQWIDHSRTIDTGGFKRSNHSWHGNDPVRYECAEKDRWNEPLGKDLDLGRVNKYGNDCGVRGHEDRSRFIIQQRINIYPGIDCQWNKFVCNNIDECMGCLDNEKFDNLELLSMYDFKSCPDCVMKNITWDQAKAYYHWRLKTKAVQKFIKKNPTGSMLPTKEQWIKISKGEPMILPEKAVEIPLPVFRFTVNVSRSEQN